MLSWTSSPALDHRQGCMRGLAPTIFEKEDTS